MGRLYDWHKFRALSWRKRLMLAEAAFWLCVARLALLVLRFSWIASYLGQWRPPEPERPSRVDGFLIAREISWAVDRSAQLLPFRMVCLPRALAGWQMLHFRKLSGRLHLGAAPGAEKSLLTHAWLDACGARVAGYPVATDCVEIGYFSR